VTRASLMTFLKLAGFAVVVGLAVQLYRAKTAAEAQRAHIEALQRDIASERRALTALRAEEAYQERPARLRELAAERLGMQPIQAYQLRALAPDSAPAPGGVPDGSREQAP
jgi:cell division protein FtsL